MSITATDIQAARYAAEEFLESQEEASRRRANHDYDYHGSITGIALETCLPEYVQKLAAEVERLQLYERAMQSMAAQFVCPRMTAEELVLRQLDADPAPREPRPAPPERVKTDHVGDKIVPVLVWPDGSSIHLAPHKIDGGQDPAVQLRNWLAAWLAHDLAEAGS